MVRNRHPHPLSCAELAFGLLVSYFKERGGFVPGVVEGFIDFIPLDLKPGEPLAALGMVGGGVNFAPPDLKPRGVIVVFAFRITRRGIELAPFDFEPGHRITSNGVVWRFVDLAHALTFSSLALPGPLKGEYRGWALGGTLHLVDQGSASYFFLRNSRIFLFTDSRPL